MVQQLLNRRKTDILHDWCDSINDLSDIKIVTNHILSPKYWLRINYYYAHIIYGPYNMAYDLYNTVTVMLVTSWCFVTLWWWLIWDVGVRIIMLVTFFVMLVQCIKSVTNILNLSPTHLVSNIRHQHRCNHIIPLWSFSRWDKIS